MSDIFKTPQQRRDEAQKEAFVKGFTAVVVLLASLPFQAWPVMLVFGALHGAFAAVPAIGYGTTILFVLGANIFTARVRRLLGK